MRLLFSCPVCGSKKVEVRSECKVGSVVFKVLSCNHTIQERKLQDRQIDNKLLDGRILYPFQLKGAEFARDSGFRCLIADEMGLGKTIQAVSLLVNFPELRPALIVAKASLSVNWMREIANGARLISQILDSDSEALTTNGKITIDCYITSYDSLVKRKRKGIREEEPAKWRESIKYNLLILDEVQMIKNHDSKRTQQVRDLARNCNKIIALSGTPIKNNAGEYFPTLNILRPDSYRNQVDFIRLKTCSYWDGYRYKIGGLRNPERFAEETKDFIIRRTRKEVLPDLPSTRISYRYITMMDQVQKAYNTELDSFTNFMNNPNEEKEEQEHITNILAYMNRMRHITGIAKVVDVLAYVEEFLEDREGEEKLTIFHHHIDVGKLIVEGIGKQLQERENNEKVLRLSSEMNSSERSDIIDRFKDDKLARILVAPTLACGEGINLQFCNTVILCEREWNPANEEQAAPGRFSRIGSKAEFIDVAVPVAINSIDELFAEYVERKRQNINEALNGKKLDISQAWNQSQVIKDIAEKLMQQNMKSWRRKVGV